MPFRPTSSRALHGSTSKRIPGGNSILRQSGTPWPFQDKIPGSSPRLKLRRENYCTEAQIVELSKLEPVHKLTSAPCVLWIHRPLVKESFGLDPPANISKSVWQVASWGHDFKNVLEIEGGKAPRHKRMAMIRWSVAVLLVLALTSLPSSFAFSTPSSVSSLRLGSVGAFKVSRCKIW